MSRPLPNYRELDGSPVTNYTDNIPLTQVVRWDLTEPVSIYWLLDNSIISSKFPFASAGEFFKTLKGYKPNLAWIRSQPEYNTYMNQGLVSGVPQFSNISAGTDFVQIDQAATFSGDLHSTILDALPVLDGKLGTRTIAGSKSIFYIYGLKHFNEALFLDFITNNSIAKKWFVIKESTVLLKKRKPIRLQFRLPNGDGSAKVSILPGILDKGDELFKFGFWRDVGAGNPYLRIQITASDELTPELLERVKISICRLVRLYEKEAPKLHKIYSDFIPLKELEYSKSIKMEKDPKMIYKDPEMFVNNYPTFCQKSQGQQPDLVTKEMAEQMVADGEIPQYLEYPVTEDYLNMMFPEGVPPDVNPIPIPSYPRYLVCNDKRKPHPWPGLKPNVDLSNRELFPYLPCCYLRDQWDRGGGDGKETGVWDYLLGNPPGKVRVDTKGDIAVKGRGQLKPGVRGTLPPAIADMLSLFAPVKRFARYGIEGTREDSFLSCLNRATGSSLTREDIVEFVNSMKQENWNLDIDQIRERVLDSNTYLDPVKTVTGLQRAFGAKIFLFEVSDDSPRGNFAIPDHTHGHLEWSAPHVAPFIMIFLSRGAKGRRYETCELVIEERGGESFGQIRDPALHADLARIRNIAHQQFNPFKTYSTFKFPRMMDTITRQDIDMYGKLRRVEVGGIVLETPPLPPLNVEIASLPISVASSKQIQWLERNGWNESVRMNDYSRRFMVGGIPFIARTADLPITTNLPDYVATEKSARNLTDITLKAFALYLDGATPDANNLNQFFRKNVRIGGDESRWTSLPPFYNDDMTNKIKVPNEATKERLKYVLEILSKRNPDFFGELRSNNFLPHYYTYLTDFNGAQNIIYSKGRNNTVMAIYNTGPYRLYNTIEQISHPYFVIAPWTLSNKPVLVANSSDEETALKVGMWWNEYGFMPTTLQLLDYDEDVPEEFLFLDLDGDTNAGPEDSPLVIARKGTIYATVIR